VKEQIKPLLEALFFDKVKSGTVIAAEAWFASAERHSSSARTIIEGTPRARGCSRGKRCTTSRSDSPRWPIAASRANRTAKLWTSWCVCPESSATATRA